MKNYQFYHIYPLGMLNKLQGNDTRTLQDLNAFLPHLRSMNINALYIGPIFESQYHGYDTIDYERIDPRLGEEDDFIKMVTAYHHQGIKVIVDCVFNHVAREFSKFKDVINHGENSMFKDWFYIDFSRNNHRNDGFSYDDWAGHDELVKLNLQNPYVREYLIQVSKEWIYKYDIDGLRLDAADVMDRDFIRHLVIECRKIKKDFYVVAEMVHGDYRAMIEETGIDSVTNYEAYKGMYSSLNDKNYFEIAYSFKRHFAEGGVTKDYQLYNFCDNHDVNRVADSLISDKHLYPLYLMLYTMKGYTSIYYKSELGEKGRRSHYGDLELRKPFYIEEIRDHDLLRSIQSFSRIRKEFPLLSYGDYKEVYLAHDLIGYLRFDKDNKLLVLINASDEKQVIQSHIYDNLVKEFRLEGKDILNNESICGDYLDVDPCWGRIVC